MNSLQDSHSINRDGAVSAALSEAIQDILAKQMGSAKVEIVPISKQMDRMVRLRTLEEFLEEFDQGTESQTIGYLVQIKPTTTTANESYALGSDIPSRALPDGVYLAEGKLNIQFLLRNAELLFRSGEYVLCRNIFQTIRQSGEKTALALHGIARCLEAEGRLDQSRSHFEESIAYHPTLESYQNLSNILSRLGKHAEAAETFERALQLKELAPKTKVQLHSGAGNCWARAQQLQSAEGHYQKALDIDPTADEILANLGALYLQFGRTKEAKRRFEDALISNPRNEKALTGLGSCFLAEGDSRLAHDTFARSLEIQLNNPTAIFFLVKCAYEIKSYTTAARILEEYVRIAPVNAALLYSLAGLQYHVGRLNDADSTARQILEVSPGHSGAMELRQLIGRYATQSG